MFHLQPGLRVMLLWLTGLLADGGEPPPSLSDLPRFPCCHNTAVSFHFAKAHLCWLKSQGELDSHNPAWARWISATEWRVEVWEMLYIAHDKDYDDETRLKKLRRLKHFIGDDDYRNGIMPEPAALAFCRR